MSLPGAIEAPPPRPLKGVALVTLAVMAFALQDVVFKLLVANHAVPLIAACRFGVNLVLVAALLGPRLGRGLVRTRRSGLVLIRGLSLVVASLAMGLALRVMPVAETVAIVYLAPFVVLLIAVPLLGEEVGPAGWIGAGAGFLGVLLIVRPGAGLDALGVVFALVAAAMSAVYMLLSRMLAATESTAALLFYSALIGTLVFGAMLPWSWPEHAIGLPDAALMLGLGALATLGHFLFTSAYREAPASLIAPVNYMHLVWAGLLGWLVFGHVPDGVTVFGMGLVAGAGVAVALRSHLAQPRGAGLDGAGGRRYEPKSQED